MANFPTEGTVGDPHEESGITWIYDGTKWVKQSTQVTTDIVELSNSDLLIDLPVVDTVLPGAPEIFTNQNNANEYIVSCLKSLDGNFSDYLPLTGGTVVGDVNIKGVLKIDRNGETGEAEGFSIEGNLPIGVDGNYLLGVYHNGNVDAGDAVNYNGRTDMDSNIQTKESVEALLEGSVKKTGDVMTGKLTLSNDTAINLKGKIQIEGTTTNSRFLGTDANGKTSWKTAMTSQTNADWNQSNSGNVSYIKNKPTVVTGSTSGIKITSANGNYYIQG